MDRIEKLPLTSSLLCHVHYHSGCLATLCLYNIAHYSDTSEHHRCACSSAAVQCDSLFSTRCQPSFPVLCIQQCSLSPASVEILAPSGSHPYMNAWLPVLFFILLSKPQAHLHLLEFIYQDRERRVVTGIYFLHDHRLKRTLSVNPNQHVPGLAPILSSKRQFLAFLLFNQVTFCPVKVTSVSITK